MERVTVERQKLGHIIMRIHPSTPHHSDWKHHHAYRFNVTINKCNNKYKVYNKWIWIYNIFLHQEQELVEEQKNLRASLRDPGPSDSEPPQQLLTVCWWVMNKITWIFLLFDWHHILNGQAVFVCSSVLGIVIRIYSICSVNNHHTISIVIWCNYPTLVITQST